MIKSFAKTGDQIPGGLADKKSPSDFDPEQLEKGIKAEMEHTSSRDIATEIAMDHLMEDPKYYDKLEKIEGPHTKKAWHIYGPTKYPNRYRNFYNEPEQWARTCPKHAGVQMRRVDSVTYMCPITAEGKFSYADGHIIQYHMGSFNAENRGWNNVIGLGWNDTWPQPAFLSLPNQQSKDNKELIPYGRNKVTKPNEPLYPEAKIKVRKLCKIAQSAPTEAMEDLFKERTSKHISLVQKYLNRLEEHFPYDFEIDEHDASKFKEPEYEPYLYITWKHKKENEGEDYEIPSEWKDKCHEATFHHTKNNKHHPEYWDDSLTENPINKEDRNEPSGEMVDATKMPKKHLLEMVADWCAMSEELGKNTPKEWADKNIGVRWEFSPEQENLIYKAIDLIWEPKTALLKGLVKKAKPFNAPPGTKGKEDKKKKQPGPHKLRPREWENMYHNEEGSDTMLTSLPATFIPAPGGYQGRIASFQVGDRIRLRHSPDQQGTISFDKTKERKGTIYYQVAFDLMPEDIQAAKEYWKDVKPDFEPQPVKSWVPEDQLVKIGGLEPQPAEFSLVDLDIPNFYEVLHNDVPIGTILLKKDKSSWGHSRSRSGPWKWGYPNLYEAVQALLQSTKTAEKKKKEKRKPGASADATLFQALGLGVGADLKGLTTKRAQYSSETLSEWQKLVPTIGGETGLGRRVNLEEELPSLWQEILIVAYEIGSESLVQKVEEKSTIAVMPHRGPAVRAFYVRAFYDDQARNVNLFLNQAAMDRISEGDVGFVDYINSVVVHEFKHLFDDLQKSSEWKKRYWHKPEEAGEQYYESIPEQSAIHSEVRLAAQQMRDQGYDLRTALQHIPERIAKYRGWTLSSRLRNQIESIILDVYEKEGIVASIKKFTKRAKRLTIGVDIDGVIADFNRLLREIASQYIPITKQDKHAYHIRDLEHGSEEIENKVMAEVYEKHRIPDAPVMEGAVEKINEMYDRGHKIVILTARGNDWYDQTEEWLKKIGLKYHKLIHDKDKGARAVQEGIDIFIDDKPKNVEDVSKSGVRAYVFDQPWNRDIDVPRITEWKNVKAMTLGGLIKFSAPRWTTEEKNRLKELYIKYRERGIPHHIIYKAAAVLLNKSFLAVKQKLENMYEIDEELSGWKYEHWDQNKIDQMIRDLYLSGQPINRLSLPANLMYQITNHSLPKARTCGFPAYYDSFDHAVASNILAIGFERDGDKLTEKAIESIEDALQYYRRREKMAHAWDKNEIVALLQDAHSVGLPLTYSFFKSHPDIYKPLIGVGRSLEGLRDSIKRNGYGWSDLVIEAVPEYVEFYTDDGKLTSSTEEMRIRRFLELNDVPFRIAELEDKIEITDPELLEQGYRNFVPDFFILDGQGQTQAIVEVFGSVADSAASNTAELYREKKQAKEKFYQTLPYTFIAINNNTDGIDLTDEILREKFSTFIV